MFERFERAPSRSSALGRWRLSLYIFLIRGCRPRGRTHHLDPEMARKSKKDREPAAPEGEREQEQLSALHRVSPNRILGIGARLRAYMLAGILVTAPIGITFYFAWLVVGFFDNRVKPLIPAAYNPETYLPFGVPGLGLVVFLAFLIFVGWVAAGLLGRWFVRATEHLLNRMPIIRSVYSAIKQIVETIVSHQSETFRQVVLFEYPRRGSWALGFITGKTQGEVQNLTSDEVINVFLPTTPNPTSGYLLFIPRKELIILDMTVEEGIKMVVSGGIVTPTDRRPAEVQAVPKVAPASRTRQTIPYEPKS